MPTAKRTVTSPAVAKSNRTRAAHAKWLPLKILPPMMLRSLQVATAEMNPGLATMAIINSKRRNNTSGRQIKSEAKARRKAEVVAARIPSTLPLRGKKAVAARIPSTRPPRRKKACLKAGTSYQIPHALPAAKDKATTIASSTTRRLDVIWATRAEQALRNSARALLLSPRWRHQLPWPHNRRGRSAVSARLIAKGKAMLLKSQLERARYGIRERGAGEVATTPRAEGDPREEASEGEGEGREGACDLRPVLLLSDPRRKNPHNLSEPRLIGSLHPMHDTLGLAWAVHW